jgi:hypothetical protein
MSSMLANIWSRDPVTRLCCASATAFDIMGSIWRIHVIQPYVYNTIFTVIVPST